MLYCNSCKREVDENETEIGGKIDTVEHWPNDGINPAPNEKMVFAVRKHKGCGGEVTDKASVERVKKALYPDAE